MSAINSHTTGSDRLGVTLTILLGLPTLGFFCFAAFDPAALAAPIFPGKPVSLWFAYGLGLIAYSVILACVYVALANRQAARVTMIGLLAIGLALMPGGAQAAEAAPGHVNATAVIMFLILVLFTLGITYWAARRTRSANDFYAAGGKMTVLQNGLAIAGDSISAGAFLGLTGLVFGAGYNGLMFATGYCVGSPVIVLLFADKMRNMGKFTFADILASRLAKTPIRALAAATTLTVVVVFLVAQMVGAGQLIQLLFGLDYLYAELAVGGLMVIYVMFGGMMATTWVQMIKAVLMLVSGAVISLLALSQFGFDYNALLSRAIELHPKHAAMLQPTGFSLSPLSTLSLGLAMFFGSAGFPHVIMRMFTVPDAKAARTSMMWASVFIAAFFAMVSVIGPSAVALVMGRPEYMNAAGGLLGGGNMAAIHLAHAVGGDLMLGFVSAVAFATILAVVSGLTLAGASAVSHDLYANIICKGHADERREVFISRVATLVLGAIAVGLGIAFRTQNIAYLITLVVGISASTNFPLLLLAIYWRGLTTKGALAGGIVGLISSVVMTVLGPAVWVTVLGHAAPAVSLDPPTIVTMPLAFMVCIGVSLMDRSRQAAQDRAAFDSQRSPDGLVASAAE